MSVEAFRFKAWLWFTGLEWASYPVEPSPIESDNAIGPGESMDLVLQGGRFHVVPKSRGDA